MTDAFGGNVLERRQRAAAEFVAWSEHHAQDRRHHEALLAQVESHPDRLDARNAMAQQRAWAQRETHSRHLHDSAMAQLRHR